MTPLIQSKPNTFLYVKELSNRQFHTDAIYVLFIYFLGLDSLESRAKESRTLRNKTYGLRGHFAICLFALHGNHELTATVSLLYPIRTTN